MRAAMHTSPIPSALVIGEALIDRLPSGEVVAGAPLNVARHLQMLGVPALMVSRVGEDANGRRVAATLQAAGLSLDGLQRDAQQPTGVVDVELDAAGQARYTIRSPAAWDHIETEPLQALLRRQAPRLVVFGTLAQRHADSRAAHAALLAEAGAQGALRFCDLNLRTSVPDIEQRVRDCVAQAEGLKLNDEELPHVLGWLGQSDVPALMRSQPQLQCLLLTQGAKGFEAYDGEGRLRVQAPCAPVAQLADTVGAGDAFFGFTLAALMHGRELWAALPDANRFAAAMCGEHGAAPADPERFYPPWRALLS